MKFRHLVLTAAMLAMPALMSAEAWYMHVRTSDGNWQVINLDNVDRLTFAGGNMVASKGGSTVATVPQSSLSQMAVTETSGVDDVTADADAGPGFEFDGSCLKATADTPLAIYGTDGALMVEIPAVKPGETVALDAMPAGMYIVKSSCGSIKIVKK